MGLHNTTWGLCHKSKHNLLAKLEDRLTGICWPDNTAGSMQAKAMIPWGFEKARCNVLASLLAGPKPCLSALTILGLKQLGGSWRAYLLQLLGCLLLAVRSRSPNQVSQSPPWQASTPEQGLVRRGPSSLLPPCRQPDSPGRARPQRHGAPEGIHVVPAATTTSVWAVFEQPRDSSTLGWVHNILITSRHLEFQPASLQAHSLHLTYVRGTDSSQKLPGAH